MRLAATLLIAVLAALAAGDEHKHEQQQHKQHPDKHDRHEKPRHFHGEEGLPGSDPFLDKTNGGYIQARVAHKDKNHRHQGYHHKGQHHEEGPFDGDGWPILPRDGPHHHKHHEDGPFDSDGWPILPRDADQQHNHHHKHYEEGPFDSDGWPILPRDARKDRQPLETHEHRPFDSDGWPVLPHGQPAEHKEPKSFWSKLLGKLSAITADEGQPDVYKHSEHGVDQMQHSDAHRLEAHDVSNFVKYLEDAGDADEYDDDGGYHDDVGEKDKYEHGGQEER